MVSFKNFRNKRRERRQIIEAAIKNGLTEVQNLKMKAKQEREKKHEQRVARRTARRNARKLWRAKHHLTRSAFLKGVKRFLNYAVMAATVLTCVLLVVGTGGAGAAALPFLIAGLAAVQIGEGSYEIAKNPHSATGYINLGLGLLSIMGPIGEAASKSIEEADEAATVAKSAAKAAGKSVKEIEAITSKASSTAKFLATAGRNAGRLYGLATVSLSGYHSVEDFKKGDVIAGLLEITVGLAAGTALGADAGIFSKGLNESEIEHLVSGTARFADFSDKLGGLVIPFFEKSEGESPEITTTFENPFYHMNATGNEPPTQGSSSTPSYETYGEQHNSNPDNITLVMQEEPEFAVKTPFVLRKYHPHHVPYIDRKRQPFNAMHQSYIRPKFMIVV
jgi:hypothetical protein